LVDVWVIIVVVWDILQHINLCYSFWQHAAQWGLLWMVVSLWKPVQAFRG